MLRELARLRLDHMRGPAYPGTDTSLDFHHRMLEKIDAQGEIRSASGLGLVAWREHQGVVQVDAHHAGHAAARAWLESTLREVVPSLSDPVELFLPGHDTELRIFALAQLGLGLHNVNLAGHVKTGLERLIAAYDPPETVPGVQIRRGVPADADAMIAMRARVFGEEPAYHPRGATKEFQDRAHASIVENAPDRPRWVVVSEGQVRGFFETAVFAPCPHHGSSAGMGLMLDRELRGKGLAKIAYRILLTYLDQRGIVWFKGFTARPAVLHLSRVMGRQLLGVTLRRDHTFPPEWFGL